MKNKRGARKHSGSAFIYRATSMNEALSPTPRAALAPTPRPRLLWSVFTQFGNPWRMAGSATRLG